MQLHENWSSSVSSVLFTFVLRIDRIIFGYVMPATVRHQNWRHSSTRWLFEFEFFTTNCLALKNSSNDRLRLYGCVAICVYWNCNRIRYLREITACNANKMKSAKCHPPQYLSLFLTNIVNFRILKSDSSTMSNEHWVRPKHQGGNFC